MTPVGVFTGMCGWDIMRGVGEEAVEDGLRKMGCGE